MRGHGTIIFGVAFGLISLFTLTATAAVHNEMPSPALDQAALDALIKELKENPPPALQAKADANILDGDDELVPLGGKSAKDLLAHSMPAKDYEALNNKAADVASNKEPAPVDTKGLSPLEARYSARAGERLVQFGYDIFSKPDGKTPAATGAGDDYQLGQGDEVQVLLRGQRNQTQTYTVDQDGRLLVDNMRPVMAAGRSLKDVAHDVEGEVRSSMLDTQAFVSLARLRKISVQVLGDVAHPGRQQLSGYGSILDALNAAGGVTKTGSLRRISLSRADDWQKDLDLYQLLLTGTRAVDIPLKDGDKILVPPIGDTVAIAGPVKRAGIYELPKNTAALSLKQILYVAGETHTPDGLQFMRSHVTRTGADTSSTLADENAVSLSDNDIVFADAIGGATRNAVQLTGAVLKPRRVALSDGQTLGALLGDGSSLPDDVYPLMGVVEHYDHKTLTRDYSTFSPKAVLSGTSAIKLADGDKVKLFSEHDVKQMTTLKVAADASGKLAMFAPPPNKNDAYDTAEPAQKLLQDHNVTMRGALVRPGNYPIASDATLAELVSAAGGMTRNADRQNVEVITTQNDADNRRAPSRTVYDLNDSNPHSIMIPAGAAVRIAPKTDMVQRDGVTLAGEVKRPGTYDIMRGEKLSSVIARAGGLTPEAYAAGTIFTRDSARRTEAAQFQAAAQQLDQITAGRLSASKPPNQDQVEMARKLAEQLRTTPAVGRITVEANPEQLRAQPELDTLLEAGDKIYVPPRRTTVSVMGEVYHPAALHFITRKDGDAYVEEAGGPTRFADESHAYILQPNGAARPLNASAWNHEDSKITPGSTIVMPVDPDHYDTIQLVSGIGNILAQLAVSTAAVASLNDNNNN